MSITPSAQNILVGDTVSLSCEVNSSYPPVSAYQWYKDGAAAGTERTLTLRGVRRADHGQYRCEAHNALGAGTAPPVMLYIFCKCRGAAGWGGGTQSERDRGNQADGTGWESVCPGLGTLGTPACAHAQVLSAAGCCCTRRGFHSGGH